MVHDEKTSEKVPGNRVEVVRSASQKVRRKMLCYFAL